MDLRNLTTPQKVTKRHIPDGFIWPQSYQKKKKKSLNITAFCRWSASSLSILLFAPKSPDRLLCFLRLLTHKIVLQQYLCVHFSRITEQLFKRSNQVHYHKSKKRLSTDLQFRFFVSIRIILKPRLKAIQGFTTFYVFKFFCLCSCSQFISNYQTSH